MEGLILTVKIATFWLFETGFQRDLFRFMPFSTFGETTLRTTD